MRTIRLITQCVLLLAFSVFLRECPAAAEGADDGILFFYSESCPSCHEMKAELDELLVLNPELPLQMLEIGENADAWQSTCEKAGIPAWGVPRLFVGDQVFADWSNCDGELIYVPAYYGYLGYRNQVFLAIEAVYGELILPEKDESPER